MIVCYATVFILMLKCIRSSWIICQNLLYTQCYQGIMPRVGVLLRLMVVDYECIYSLSGRTSYRKISWNLEAARFGFKFFNGREIWQAPREQHQLSERHNRYDIQSSGVETPRDLAVRRLIAWSIETQIYFTGVGDLITDPKTMKLTWSITFITS